MDEAWSPSWPAGFCSRMAPRTLALRREVRQAMDALLGRMNGGLLVEASLIPGDGDAAF